MNLIGNDDSFKGVSHEIVKALISDYVMVYYIDVADKSYMEFASDPETKELVSVYRGENFFERCAVKCADAVYYKDMGKVMAALQKDNLESLISDAPFMITYRLVINEKPVWHTLKALYADNGKHILIAVRNIDVQKTREADYEKKLLNMSIQINRDALTKVKNQRAFVQEEAKWDEQIAQNGENVRFSIVMCDINGLKTYNDTMGHREGDARIVSGAKIISDIFKHSPVFRIGGDEFVAVLTEQDYEMRELLLARLRAKILQNRDADEVVVASGMADFDPERDNSFSDVFARADVSMYENKKALKRTV